MRISSGGSTAPHHPLPGHLAKYPTPFHVYFEKEALADAAALERGLKSALPSCELFYSVKTNPLLPLLRALKMRGWGMEVVGELNVRAALDAGCDPGSLLLNGAAWTRAELDAAVKRGVRRFTADSLAMARLLAEVAPIEAQVALRVHDGDSHFGLAMNQLKEAREALPRLKAFGLQLHVNPPGSDENFAADFRARAEKLKEAAAASGGADFFDLGGGFDSPFVFRPHPRELGAFHDPGQAQKFRQRNGARFSLEEAGAEAARAVAAVLGAQTKILFEPGRAVCTRALSTVLGVRAIKTGLYPEAQIVITDGSTAALGPLHRAVHPLWPEGEQATFVYGSLPHSADWLFQNVKLPALKAGDRLCILHTGAYFLALEASFGQELPAIVHADRDEILR